MDYKVFYRDLMKEMNTVLKPQGFRKAGSCFRCELENGIVGEIEVQKSQFNLPSQGWSQFTINIKAGLFPLPVTVFSRKRNALQIQGNLGTAQEKGWGYQHWYRVLDPADPRRKDGAWTLTYQEPGKAWQEKQIPCPLPDEIIKEVCELLVEKVLPFYQSLQTLDGYLNMLERAEEMGLHSTVTHEDCEFYAKVYGERFLPCLDKYQEKAIKAAQWKESQDMSQYDELLQQHHKESVAEYWNRVAFYERLKERING